MAAKVEIFVDGKAVQVPTGISVAAAVLGHTHHSLPFHTNTMDGSARAPYCLMGVCFECMMEINGKENVQSCLVAVEEGMQIKRQLQSTSFSYTEQNEFTPNGVNHE